jgi:hypothetical protein
MDISFQKKTWSSFVKFTIYISITIIFIIAIMAIFLL